LAGAYSFLRTFWQLAVVMAAMKVEMDNVCDPVECVAGMGSVSMTVPAMH